MKRRKKEQVRSFAVVAVAVASWACAPRPVAGPSPGSLEGLTLPLIASAPVRLSVEGSVGKKGAVIELDPGVAMSFVSDGCLEERRVVAHVVVGDPFRPDENFPVTHVRDLYIGDILMPPLDAALAEGSRCRVVAGDDVLKGLALHIDVGARQVRFAPSRSSAEWVAALPRSDQAVAVPLTRDPQRDWPLVPVRFTQGSSQLTGAVIFSAREGRSTLLEVPAREAGLSPGLEMWGQPPPVLDDAAPGPPVGFVVEKVELAEGVGVSNVLIDVEPGLGDGPLHAAVGILGADVWGRFNAIVDVGAAVVVLHRPHSTAEGRRPACARGGVESEEACIEVHGRRDGLQLSVSAAVWRAIPDGARLTFDVPAARGVCALGFSFPPSDSGRTMLHQLPWRRLTEVMPECARALSGAMVTPGLFEEGALPQCPGLCVYAQDVASGRLSCQCQPTHPALDEGTEQWLLEQFKSRRQAPAAPPLAPADREPADPP